MPEFGEKQIKKIQETSQKAKSAALLFKKRFIAATKSVAYWSSVVTVGIFLSGVIAHFGFGVEMFSVANAGLAEGIAMFLGNILYYGYAIVLLAALTVSFILEIVLLYPYGNPVLFTAWSGNGFVNVDQVVIGWKLVRDICNIFFSLILVIIALASVLKIEAYSWKQLLPKFFIAAILINFSKSIAGIFTDFGTVAMATFGSSFSGSFARGLIGAFGLPALGDFTPIETGSNPNREGSGFASVLFAYVAAAGMVAVFFVLMCVFTATLVFRIIMLWFLIILSPFAYITRILPLTQRYSSQWWEMFGRYVVVGPLVTFFLWLSLTMAFGGQNSGAAAGQGFNNSNPITAAVGTATTPQAASAGITAPPQVGNFQSTNPNVIVNFIVATLLLVASLKLISQMAQEFGQFTGSIESTATGLVTNMSERLGQSGIMLGSKMGIAPQRDDAGNIKERGSWDYYIGQGITAVSATIGQPLTFAKSAIENITNSSAARQKNARVKAADAIGLLRRENVLKRSDSGGGAIGVLANITGALAGAGMQDGKVVFDGFLSGEGMLRAMEKGGLLLNGELAKIEAKRQEAKKIGEDIKKEQGKLQEGEGPEALEHLADVLSSLTTANNNVKNLGDANALHNANGDLTADHLKNVMLDTNDSAVRSFLEAHMNSLQADQQRLQRLGKTTEANTLGVQMQMLQEQLNIGGTFNASELLLKANGLSSIPGGIRDPEQRKKTEIDTFNKLKQIFDANKKELESERDGLKRGLKNTGYEFIVVNGQETDAVTKDANGKIIHGKEFLNPERLKKLQEAQYTAAKYADKLETHLASLSGDDGQESRKARQQALAEAEQSLDGVVHANQLLEFMDRAKRQGNSYVQEAAFLRLEQNSDLNDATQGYASVNDDGTFNEKAGTGVNQLWSVIDKEFKHYTYDQKLALLTKISVRAAAKDHLDLGYATSYSDGGYKRNSEELQNQIALTMTLKKGMNVFAGAGVPAYGSKDAMGNVKVFQDGGKRSVGVEMLIRYAEQLAAPTVFNRMNGEVLQTLSEPAVTASLEEAGVHPAFIARLRQFRSNVSRGTQQGGSGRSKFVR